MLGCYQAADLKMQSIFLYLSIKALAPTGICKVEVKIVFCRQNQLADPYFIDCEIVSKVSI
jgi:hypothetical protein